MQESCFTVILDGHSVVYVAKAHFRRIMVASVDIGSRAPAYTYVPGRVLLSGLSEDALESYLHAVKLEALTQHTVTSKIKLKARIDEARQLGYCIVDQEFEVGLRSISAHSRAFGHHRGAERALPEPALHARRDAHASAAEAPRQRQRDHARFLS